MPSTKLDAQRAPVSPPPFPQAISRRTWLAGAACAAIGLPGLARGQDAWPAKPITLVAVTPAGGNSDNYLRILSVPLGDLLKTSVIVENKPGAGGTIAGKFVLDAPPDGHMVMGASGSSHVLYPLLGENVPYDVQRDFKPVAMIGVSYLALLVRADSPYKSVADIVAAAKQAPGKLTFGSPGIFGIQRLAGELFQQRTGTSLVNVPNVRGSARLDVIGGHVDMIFDSGAEEQIKGGTLRALAVSSRKRLPQLPDVPTMEEQGVRDYEVTSWAGAFVHARTPDSVVDQLNKAIVAVLNGDPGRSRLTALGLEPSPLSRQQFTDFYNQDFRKWAAVVDAQGLKKKVK